MLRTQYEVPQRDIIDSLIGFIQRVNVRVIDLRSDVLVETLVQSPGLAGASHPGRADRSG